MIRQVKRLIRPPEEKENITVRHLHGPQVETPKPAAEKTEIENDREK